MPTSACRGRAARSDGRPWSPNGRRSPGHRRSRFLRQRIAQLLEERAARQERYGGPCGHGRPIGRGDRAKGEERVVYAVEKGSERIDDEQAAEPLRYRLGGIEHRREEEGERQ